MKSGKRVSRNDAATQRLERKLGTLFLRCVVAPLRGKIFSVMGIDASNGVNKEGFTQRRGDATVGKKIGNPLPSLRRCVRKNPASDLDDLGRGDATVGQK